MSRLSRNIAYNTVGQGLFVLLGCTAVKYVFKQLGADTLGILSFTVAMSAVLGAALEMGISSTTVREVSARIETESRYVVDLIRTASLFYWVGYAVLASALWWSGHVVVERWI